MSKNKKCGFCKNIGHNILECNHPKILDIFTNFEKNINNIEFLIENIYDKFVIQCKCCLCNQCINSIIIESHLKTYLTKLVNQQSYINLRVISLKNNMTTGLQKLFLIENIIKKYYLKIQHNIIHNFNKFIKIMTDLNNDTFILEKEYTSIDISIFIILLTKYIHKSPDYIIDFFFGYYINNNDIVYDGIDIALKYLLSIGINYSTEHIYFKKKWLLEWNIESSFIYDANEFSECPICMEKIIKTEIKTKCNHSYCNDCFTNITKYRKNYQEPKCSICRRDILKIELISYCQVIK